jgi:hypothetical protein
MKIVGLKFLQIICAIVFVTLTMCGAAAARPQTEQKPQEIPKVNANIGACRADFTVKDGTGKPLYDAKIDVTIRYGFMHLRKYEVEVGTNSDGKASVIGLPEFGAKPLTFHIKSGTVSRSITDDPSTLCNAKYDVVLTVH